MSNDGLEEVRQIVKSNNTAPSGTDGYHDYNVNILNQTIGTSNNPYNEEKMNEQFQRAHAFQTSVRGIKFRGVYPTQEEAEMRCKKVREIDPNHDIYVGPVGMWIPWDPDAYKTGRVEFMEEELNQLHSEKLKNETKAKEEFDRRVKETKKKAIQENIELAKKSGNVLTQTINEEGQLIGVREKINFEERDVADSTENVNIRNELLKNAAGENPENIDL